jgi:transposase
MHVVQLSIEGHQTVSEAAQLLGLSLRQIKRLRQKFKAHGVEGVLHANRGKTAWNKTSKEKIDQVLGLAQGRYQGLNDSHLTEKLKEQEKLEVSRPVVRTILRGAGIAPVRKRGIKRHYQRRERRAQQGALLLWDGSHHRWFGDEHEPCNLTAVIDDATGMLLQGVFSLEEDAQSYLICLREILLEKGEL